MLYDDDGLYFITAKGKLFYQQLMDKSYISLSGMTSGTDSMKKISISISGPVRNIGTEKLDEIFNENTYMADIYPTLKSRTALEVFCIYKGQGEYFDLSITPITRGSFAFGGKELQAFGYHIIDSCNACGLCLTKCPQQCITVGEPFKINQENCLHCGNCYEVCPINSVIKRNAKQ
jgi:uncharacterized pyridoxamine 5'-phosphate oxidase family protein/Pyruvate/2-oxoacid:ferredoxin oxidoreductase delta subunit